MYCVVLFFMLSSTASWTGSSISLVSAGDAISIADSTVAEINAKISNITAGVEKFNNIVLDLKSELEKNKHHGEKLTEKLSRLELNYEHLKTSNKIFTEKLSETAISLDIIAGKVDSMIKTKDLFIVKPSIISINKTVDSTTIRPPKSGFATISVESSGFATIAPETDPMGKTFSGFATISVPRTKTDIDRLEYVPPNSTVYTKLTESFPVNTTTTGESRRRRSLPDLGAYYKDDKVYLITKQGIEME